MSAVPKPESWITAEEYLEGERVSEIRHEYVNGRVYAMAGASDDHNRITGNLFGELHAAFRGKRCEAFINDMKVKVPPNVTEGYYYPDVLVACDPTDNAKYFRERPKVIIEVLSPDTRRTDEREKVYAYQQVRTLEAYVLVEQDVARIAVLHRAETGWRKEVIEGLTATLRLESLGVEIPFERIYERTAVAGKTRTPPD
jgi:Uma2 family endonuclease